MKKFLLMGAAACAVFMMSSCKSKESAYKKAYEKAKAQQTLTPAQGATTPAQSTVAVTPATPATTPATDYSNVSVRTESVQLVEGAALKAYSVVVGSFGVKANALGLSSTLKGKGYSPRVVQASTTAGTMYRVVATSYDTKGEAGQSRAALAGQYPGAWLLYQK